MFKKVWQGSVQLLQLVGAGSPLGGRALPDLDLLQIANCGVPFPASMLWDIAAAVAAEEQQAVAGDRGSAMPAFEVPSCTAWLGTCLYCVCMRRPTFGTLRGHASKVWRKLCRECVHVPLETVLGVKLRGQSNQGAPLQRRVCWQQEKLEGLERSSGCQEPSTTDSSRAGGAQHALQLCNALRRLVLKRLPSPDEEPALQVSLPSIQHGRLFAAGTLPAVFVASTPPPKGAHGQYLSLPSAQARQPNREP